MKVNLKSVKLYGLDFDFYGGKPPFKVCIL